MDIIEESLNNNRSKKIRIATKSQHFTPNLIVTNFKTINFMSSDATVSAPERNISQRLDFSFFNQTCTALAKKLLGKVLVRKLASGEILKGMVVETESYLGVIDRASHSYNGKITERNQAMFLKPGTAYVYSIYGMYYCFNISSLEEGSAVLLRALEPLEGYESMKTLRQKRKNISNLKTKDLCNGPSKLCQSLNIDKSLNKIDLETYDSLWLEEGIDIDNKNIISCKRIGIDSYGEEWSNKPLRFYIKYNAFISRRNKSAEKMFETDILNNID